MGERSAAPVGVPSARKNRYLGCAAGWGGLQNPVPEGYFCARQISVPLWLRLFPWGMSGAGAGARLRACICCIAGALGSLEHAATPELWPPKDPEKRRVAGHTLTPTLAEIA